MANPLNRVSNRTRRITDYRTTALIVIDMQKAYFIDESLARSKQKLIANCNELIGMFVDNGLMTLYVCTVHQRDKSTWTLNMHDDDQGFAFDGDDDTRFVDGLKVMDDTGLLIAKTRDNAFFGTNLDEKLRARNITSLVLCGVSTHSCIGLTAAEAYAHDYHVVLACDAIASHQPRYHQPVLDVLCEEYRQEQLATRDIVGSISGYEKDEVI